jgi:GT2 family glycosyltransferase
MIGHGSGFPPRQIDYFGEPQREVQLLDGVLLAARGDRLAQRGVMFDERFTFHFYDLDFCRQARLAGLRLGTCVLSLVHESGGQAIGSPSWQAAYEKYIEKWRG